MSDTETMVKVMSAYVDGDMIEYRNKMFGGDWTPITKTVPLWNWPHYEYRIKSEEKKPVIIETWRGSAGQVVFCEAGTVTSIETQTYGWDLLATRPLGV